MKLFIESGIFQCTCVQQMGNHIMITFIPNLTFRLGFYDSFFPMIQLDYLTIQLSMTISSRIFFSFFKPSP